MARLAEVWRACVDDYLTLMGTDTPTRTMGEEAAQKLRRALLFQRDHFHETPALVVACYAYGASTPDPRRLAKLGPKMVARMAAMGLRYRTLAEASSIYPSVQNLLLAARAHGVGANVTIWHLPREGEVKEILGIPKDVNTYALIPLGYPRGRFGPVRRRPVADVIHRDRW
jgi:nitroreductase